jgi:hypothetical protein
MNISDSSTTLVLRLAVNNTPSTSSLQANFTTAEQDSCNTDGLLQASLHCDYIYLSIPAQPNMQLFVRGNRITAVDVQACDTVGSVLQQLQVCSCDTSSSSTATRALGWVPWLLAPHHDPRLAMALDHSTQACTHTSYCLWCHHHSNVNMSCKPSCLISSLFCFVCCREPHHSSATWCTQASSWMFAGR